MASPEKKRGSRPSLYTEAGLSALEYNKEHYREFADLFGSLRRSKGLTQRQISEAIGVDHSVISKVGRAAVPPPYRLIDEMTSAMGLDAVTRDQLHLLAGQVPIDLGQDEAHILAKLLAAGQTNPVLWLEIEDLISGRS